MTLHVILDPQPAPHWPCPRSKLVETAPVKGCWEPKMVSNKWIYQLDWILVPDLDEIHEKNYPFRVLQVHIPPMTKERGDMFPRKCPDEHKKNGVPYFPLNRGGLMGILIMAIPT